MKNLYLCFLSVLAILPLCLSAQNRSVQGTVKSDSGEPLAGALVVVQGTSSGTATGIEGEFTLNAADGATLEVSYLGYQSQTAIVRGGAPIDIVMTPDATKLDEVVVVGYGAQRVKDMTAPVATVKGDELAKQITANPMSALQGRVAGVQIVNSGAPGAGPSVKIRGVGSVGDYTNPLYVVDGVFVDNIDFLGSGDIEDLTVLKDASASAIYGVRAANGVVIITTRKGQQGRTTITYDGYAGVQVPVNVVKLTDRDQYVELQNLAFEGKDGYPVSPSKYPTSTDWYSELVRSALTHSHSLDVSGASERTNYSVGLGYFYQDGIMKAPNDYQRTNFRARLDQKATDWLTVGVNTIVSNYAKTSSDNESLFQAYFNPPVYPVYNEENSDAYPVKFDAPQRYGFSNTYGNPVARATYPDNRDNGLNLVFAAYAEARIVGDKLKFKTAYNLDFGSWRTSNYMPEYFVGGSQGQSSSTLSKTQGQRNKQIVDNTLTYADRRGKHNFSVMLGQSTRTEQLYGITGSGTGVPSDAGSMYIANGSTANKQVDDKNPAPYLYHGLSFFARATYGFDNRYLATVTFRADGSSKYNEHWGYFPSVGLGWVISEEQFMKSQSVLDFLKLRASWGMLGNDNIPANSIYRSGSAGVATSGIFGDKLVEGVGSQTVIKNTLLWEVVEEWDAGVDFSMLGGRLNGELDYYNRTTRRVVFYAPVAAGGGTAELLGNNGTVRNSGFEFSIGWSDKVGSDFSYNVGINATTISNKVVSLNGAREFIPGAQVRSEYTTRTQVGYPIGAFWGYKVEGVYANAAEAVNDPLNASGAWSGYFKYANTNGDDKRGDGDQTYLGSPIPKLLLGVDFGFTWKKLDFSLTLQGQFGNKILNAKRMNRDLFPDGNYDLDFYKNAWRADATSDTYPSPEALNSSLTLTTNSFFVEDGSYFRIQNIQVGYTFGGMKWANSIRVYVAAQRPFTYFTYNGFSPEVSGSPIATGIDSSTYPMQSIYTVGLRLNF